MEVEESNKLEEILVEELQDSIQVYEERGLEKEERRRMEQALQANSSQKMDG